MNLCCLICLAHTHVYAHTPLESITTILLWCSLLSMAPLLVFGGLGGFAALLFSHPSPVAVLLEGRQSTNKLVSS